MGSGSTLLEFFKPKRATDGAKESLVLIHSICGGGASGDADVGTTEVVSKGQGGAGASSFADVVATGVVNGLEDCEGGGIDMDSVFSDAAGGSGPALKTLVHAPICFAGLRPAVREPVLQHYSLTLHGIGNQGVLWEAWINLNRLSLHAVLTSSRGILSPGFAGTVKQPGGTCAPCLDIKGTTAYTGMATLGDELKRTKSRLRRHKLVDNENHLKFSH